MSNPHCWKGQGLVIDVKGSDGRREILACSWQILHFLTRSVPSLSIVGQYYPCLKTFPANARAPI